MLTIGEDTGGYAKRYRCPLGIYLMTVLSSLYSIIMDRAINAPGHGWICFGTKCKDKYYLKGQMELVDKLASDDTTTIGMLHSASKDVSIRFLDQCLNILNNKEILNGLKGSKII